MFFQLIIAMLLGLGCPSDSNNTNTNDGPPMSTQDDGGDTGGDHGHIPPPKNN